jgi:hypothetical protein
MRIVAGSVQGPSHAREGIPCQDTWLAVFKSSASLAVICDGMSSRSHAKEGAQAAVRASRDAWRAWCKSPVGSGEDLIRLLEVFWRLRIVDIPLDQAATTCLLYAEDGHGRAALAQLGDGLLARRTKDGRVLVHPSRTMSFGHTQALGTPHTLSDWSIRIGEPIEPGEAIVLATDGVSVDLVPERLSDFMAWVMGDLGSHPQANRLLRAELRNWPVPLHQDDKTLLVMWNPCNQ